MIKVGVWFDNEYITQEFNLPRMWVVDVREHSYEELPRAQKWALCLGRLRTHTTLFPAKPTRKQVSRCIRAAKKVFKSS